MAARLPRSTYAVERLTEEFYVGIDADTVIAPDAIAKLMPHFEDPLVGAVAGNAKVGNRVNLWTRWQALEYITSQNFERRALDLIQRGDGGSGCDWRLADRAGEGGGRLSAEYRGRRRRPDHEPAGAGVEGGVRRSLAGLYRGADRRQGADAAALPLVVWNAAGGVEASRGVYAQQGDGIVCAAEHHHLSRCCCRWFRRLST
jgi:hypothetical protein